MKKTLVALGAAALILVPVAVEAQGFAIAGRAGTLGIGAEAALGLGPKLAIRGGLGLMPLERDASSFWDAGGTDVDLTIKLPEKWYNVGLDLYLGGGFRIGGGMLFKPDDPTLTATVRSGTIEIDGTTFTSDQISEVVGSIDSKSQAPYAIIGFGRHTKSGIGLFLDMGMAFLGDSPVKLRGTKGTYVNEPVFTDALRREEANLESDLPTWARKYWPILNLGIKVGIGG